ncbi:hypothetical protein ACTA71_005903 [Dictyostelium dimigraforme]
MVRISIQIKKNKQSFKLHESWYTSKHSILIELFQNGVSILHHTIISKNSNIIEQVEFLINKGVNIDKKQNEFTALDLAAETNQFNLFIKLIQLGAGKVLNNNTISNYYQLSNEENNDQPKKPNNYGVRPVILIENENGLGIYFKFKPQFPGIEYAVWELGEMLFGFCSPNSELVSINGFPVLLVQQIYGETLYDVLTNDPSIIYKINKSNLSKQIILAILINNADGNLSNFIISPMDSSSSNEYKLFSIDNDQSFVPSTFYKGTLFKKISLRIENSLFLFN